MKVLVLNKGNLKEKEINNTLEELQMIVGGYIEIPHLSRRFYENDIDIIINEEGKYIEGMRPEIAVVERKTNSIVDIVYGNCIFASHDDEGETVGLNEEQINIVKDELKVIAEILMDNKDIFVRALFI